MDEATLVADTLDLIDLAGPALIADSAEFHGTDVRVENLTSPGIQAMSSGTTIQLADSIIRNTQGVGMHVREGKGLLENVWIEETSNGGIQGVGDGLIGSHGATIHVLSGAFQFNERAGFLAEDASGSLKQSAFHANGMEGALNCVLQGTSRFTMEGLPVPIFEAHGDSALPLSTSPMTLPEIHALALPELPPPPTSP